MTDRMDTSKDITNQKKPNDRLLKPGPDDLFGAKKRQQRLEQQVNKHKEDRSNKNVELKKTTKPQILTGLSLLSHPDPPPLLPVNSPSPLPNNTTQPDSPQRGPTTQGVRVSAMAASWPRTVAHVDQRQNGPQIMQGSIVNDEDYVHANETKDEEEKEILEGMTHRQNHWPPQSDEQNSINHKEDKTDLTQTQENYTDHSSKEDTNATISFAAHTSNSKSDYVIRVSFLWFLLTMFLIALSLWTYPSTQDTLILVPVKNLTLWMQENKDQHKKIKICKATVQKLTDDLEAAKLEVSVSHQSEKVTTQKYEEFEAAKTASDRKLRECENKLRRMGSSA